MESYIEDNVYLYKGLPDDLDRLESYEAIKDLITPPLEQGQSVDLLRALFIKRYALFYATGMGKTYISSAYMKALKNKNHNAKFLMIIKKNQEHETPKKISKISGLTCKVFTASKDKVPTINTLDSCDVLMLTHDSLNSIEHMKSLLFIMDRITAIVADEAHLLSNLEEASSSFMLYSLSKRAEYFLGLTATPITSNISQLPKVLKLVAPMYVTNHKQLGYDLKNYGLSALPKQLNDLFTIRDRTYNNHHGIAEFVESMPHQLNAKGKDLFVVTKGNGATKQADKLVELITVRKPEKGLVYVNRKDVYSFIEPYLKSKGIRCAKINGDTSSDDRNKILSDFKYNEYDVILTNIKEALDMDSSYVIFYEFTAHVKQMIGRAERGLNPKPLDVIFMFTKDTDEYDYFIRNVYEISQEVEDILGIDFREVTRLGFK
ncbi:MAG: DEAD/DEAH box helicase [Anaeroplasmataceae bacterium]